MFALSTIVQGFVFSKIWAWFIVPALDAPHISIIEGIGIMILFAFASAKKPENLEGGAVGGFVYTIIFGAFVILAAYIVSLFA